MPEALEPFRLNAEPFRLNAQSFRFSDDALLLNFESIPRNAGPRQLNAELFCTTPTLVASSMGNLLKPPPLLAPTKM